MRLLGDQGGTGVKLRALGALGAAAVVTAAGLTGCGSSERSVANYCHYFYGAGSTLRNQYIHAGANTNSDPLATLGLVLGAPGQLANFFNQLAKRAPEEIAGDVQTIASAFQKEFDQEGSDLMDPLGGLASGLVDGLSSAGAYNRVDTWTTQNCGPPPGSSSP
jgi:hypothetical protein